MTQPRLDPKHFGPALCFLREGAGLSKAEAARRAGIRRQMWWTYEVGRYAPCFPGLLGAVYAVGSSLAELEEVMRRIQRDGAS